MVEINAAEQNKEKRMKRNEDSLRNFWDNIKCTNIWIIEVPEEEREKGPEKIFEEVIAENVLNIGKETIIEVQEVQRPIQDYPKEEHAKTHSNRTDKN